MNKKDKKYIVLGIESSCDETAAAIVTSQKEILSNVIFSQIEEHKIYGGVVPEIASRAHMEKMDEVLGEAMTQAKLGFDDIDAIAVTSGPGLIGGLIVGLMTAKAYASVHKKPLIAVNHLEGHALTARLTNEVEFPYLMLLVSGGHCQILQVNGVGGYVLIGQTIDDALGEAFDKVAKMMNLPYPNGAEVEKIAKNGDENRFVFPKPLANRDDCDFSFSGLKTAIRTKILQINDDKSGEGGISEQDKDDIAASFQKTILNILLIKLAKAIKVFRANLEFDDNKNIKLVIAGGVAANQYLKNNLEQQLRPQNVELICPPAKLCTDNAAMIAWAGLEKILANNGDVRKYSSPIDTEPKARWGLN